MNVASLHCNVLPLLTKLTIHAALYYDVFYIDHKHSICISQAKHIYTDHNNNDLNTSATCAF